MGRNLMPTPSQIKAKRSELGLTQSQAAALIGKSARAWQNWERPESSQEHRKMDDALWELFLIKSGCQNEIKTNKNKTS